MKNTTLLILLSLFIISCDEDNPVSGSNEVDVDWVLVKTSNYYQQFYVSGSSENLILSGIGYHFYYTGSSNITDLNMIEYDNDEGSDYVIFNDGSNGILSFSYNNQDFSYDLSDSYDSSIEKYGIRTNEFMSEGESDSHLQRIIYNKDLGYFTLFGSDGFLGIELNSSSPNELIDYR